MCGRPGRAVPPGAGSQRPLHSPDFRPECFRIISPPARSPRTQDADVKTGDIALDLLWRVEFYGEGGRLSRRRGAGGKLRRRPSLDPRAPPSCPEQRRRRAQEGPRLGRLIHTARSPLHVAAPLVPSHGKDLPPPGLTSVPKVAGRGPSMLGTDRLRALEPGCPMGSEQPRGRCPPAGPTTGLCGRRGPLSLSTLRSPGLSSERPGPGHAQEGQGGLYRVFKAT